MNPDDPNTWGRFFFAALTGSTMSSVRSPVELVDRASKIATLAVARLRSEQTENPRERTTLLPPES